MIEGLLADGFFWIGGDRDLDGDWDFLWTGGGDFLWTGSLAFFSLFHKSLRRSLHLLRSSKVFLFFYFFNEKLKKKCFYLT